MMPAEKKLLKMLKIRISKKNLANPTISVFLIQQRHIWQYQDCSQCKTVKMLCSPWQKNMSMVVCRMKKITAPSIKIICIQ